MVDIVVDEGTSNPDEVHQVLDPVPEGIDAFHLVPTADYDASLSRARVGFGTQDALRTLEPAVATTPRTGV